MKIKELNITEFGGLKDKKIIFSEGMNLICGENETGKSTIMLFIKYMLYGLPRKSATNPERERSVSLDGRRAVGSMIFEADGKRYAVERHFQGSRGSDTQKLVSLESGEEIKLDTQVGEHFLGVPREVFESSAAVGQMRTSEINGEKTVSAIENILVSADESVDAAKVLSGLDKIRTEYRHKNGSGGKLYHAELAIAEQREKLRTAKERSATLDEQRAKLEEKREELQRTEAEYARLDKMYGEIRNISLISQFDRLHQAESELDAARIKRKQFEAKNPAPDTLSARVQELEGLSRDRGIAFTELKSAKETLDSARSLLGDEDLAKEGERFAVLGGREKIVEGAKIQKKKATGVATFGIVLLGLALVLAVAGVALTALAQVLIWGTFLGLAVVLGIVGAVLLALGMKNKKGYLSVIAPHKDISEFDKYIALCEENLRLCRIRREALARAEAEHDAAERRLARICEKIAELLEGRGIKTEGADILTFVETELKGLRTLCAEWESICLEESMLVEKVRTIREPLASYDEESLRASISIDPSQINESTLETVAKDRKFYAMKLDAMRQNLKLLETTVIQLESNFTDPLEIADRLSRLESKQTEDREFFDALVLAMDSISEASERMQGSVTPEISRRASDIINIVSNGKYGEIGTGKKLQPSLVRGGMPQAPELLSGGTKDAVYMALRISLMMKIFENEMPPLMLDEALCQLDDGRAKQMLVLLSELVKTDMQILLFTCHRRESTICDELGIPTKVTEL